jgi:DNA invertase Pin-like site-specific DNA recombinase
MVPEFNMVAARVAAVGYIRRSHESTERTVSLAAQREAVEKYAAAQGWPLAAVLEHDGVSGGKRSRFAALDAAVKAHGARVVVCSNLDRLARDAAGLLDWTASAARRGIELHIVGRGRVEVASAAGYLGTGVEAIVATHFRLVIGEKTRDALAHLRSAGRRWTRVAPFGFRWTAAGTVEPDPTEHAVVVKALAMRSTGKSLRQISVELAAAGMLARSGRPLSAETLNAFLRRPS